MFRNGRAQLTDVTKNFTPEVSWVFTGMPIDDGEPTVVNVDTDEPDLNDGLGT